MNKVKAYLPIFSGVVAGAISGYLYYHFVGCNGGCMIASSPYISTIYGAVMGMLTVNLFRNPKPKNEAS